MDKLQEQNIALLARYELYVEKFLDSITEAKINYASNASIIKRINEKAGILQTPEAISVKEFHKMIVQIDGLKDAMNVGTAVTVDQLESKLFKKAIKDGNVTAILKCLEVLSPDKWGKHQEDTQKMEVPKIELHIENASIPQEKLDDYVKDLMEKTGQIRKSEVS